MKSKKTVKVTKKEKNNKKKVPKNLYIALSVVFVLIVGAVIFAINNKEKENFDDHEEEIVEDEFISNTAIGVIEDKEYEGLKFTNTSLISSNNSSILSTNVENLTDSDIDVRIFDILVKDSTGNMMVTLQGYVGGVVPANTSRDIVSNVDMNLSTAAEVEYVLVN